MRPAGLWVIVGVAGGCGEPSWGEPAPLAEADLWRAWDGVDPFGDPGDRTCDSLGWGAADFGDARVLDVDSQRCGWVTLAQPSLVELGRRDRLHVVVYHELMTGPADADARIGLALDGAIVWEARVPIPSDADFLVADLELKERVPAGAPLLFHVDNHGANSYHLIEVGAAPRERPGG